jgi:hypothetical protein
MEDLPPGKSIDYVEEFCSALRRLALEIPSRLPGDATALRAQKRICLALDQAPVWVIGEIGKVLFGYRAKIEARDAEFFLMNNYDREQAKAAAEDPEKAKLAAHLIPKIKEVWHKSDAEEREKYMDKMQDLLDSFVDYEILKRNHR